MNNNILPAHLHLTEQALKNYKELPDIWITEDKTEEGYRYDIHGEL